MQKRTKPPQPVPALERGLTIIEAIADAQQPMGFNALAQKIGVSQTTMARIIHVLVSRGYVTKDEERRKYLPGPRLASTLGRTEPVIDAYRHECRTTLDHLVNATECTALALHFNRTQIQCLAKVTHPASLAMQEVGTISSNVCHTPWGWILYEAMNHEQRYQSLKHVANPDAFIASIDGHLTYLHKHGFTYDPGLFERNVHRFAAPVRGENGALIGALGLGTPPGLLEIRPVHEIGESLKQAARTLSLRLGAER